ncbi:peptide ABC transporter ATP-binding protein [Sporanaerobium hydrogeniformans]|uniref:Peptide ABC transporter ATP-binding protein n=1 Tax=Sporanaerobium hydrogeniformans TaxID=3072179 RepID=A0AC61DC34_9FIRM|nr:ABC transporter ATP-binding protein [Sporanaerobium hydrogeniformans]PHV70345.1 peptide ABC transporter ATP-binding protein [Sporanaerobium hydrogeniformans]
MVGKSLFIEELSVDFMISTGKVRAVDGVSVVFESGKITGLIGESGCGKSVLGMAILDLLPAYATLNGKIDWGEQSLNEYSIRKRKLLGREIGLIPQSPSESLNPSRKVKAHLNEALRPLGLKRQERYKKAEKLLRDFGFNEPKRILKAYPHELSGGMQQRVLCAIGTACSPEWIIADEPTKGLDSELCKQVQQTLQSLRIQGIKSMLVITHDLQLAEDLCDTIAVMYGGQIVEMGDVLHHPLHPYTKAFLDALPKNGLHPISQINKGVEQYSKGCCFAARCLKSRPRCFQEKPPYKGDKMHWVRCFDAG